MISAARRRELVDELVALRSKIVLREDEHEAPPDSRLWPLGLIAVLARNRNCRELAMTITLVGLAWLEAFDELEAAPAPRSGGDRGADGATDPTV